MAEDFDKPYVFVVYRVEEQYLDGDFLEKVATYKKGNDEEFAERMQILREAAASVGEEFDEDEAAESIRRSPRWRENPWDLLIKIKAVFTEQKHAEEEVERLNKLNGHKGCRYFCQGARFYEDGRRYQQETGES